MVCADEGELLLRLFVSAALDAAACTLHVWQVLQLFRKALSTLEPMCSEAPLGQLLYQSALGYLHHII